MRAILLIPILLAFAPGRTEAQEDRTDFEGINIRIERDPSLPGNPVVKIAFGCHSEAPDADLARLSRYPELREVDVLSDKITDAGLRHLKALAHLETLKLNSSTITDKGLEHLAALSGLKSLVLFRTRATDSGLAHLKKLSGLRSLWLIRIPITSECVSQLKELANLETLGFDQLHGDSLSKATELVPLLPRTKITLPR